MVKVEAIASEVYQQTVGIEDKEQSAIMTQKVLANLIHVGRLKTQTIEDERFYGFRSDF